MWGHGYQVVSSSYLITGRTWEYGLGLGAAVDIAFLKRYPHLIPSLPGLDLRPLVIEMNYAALQLYWNTCRTLNKFAVGLLWTLQCARLCLWSPGFDIVQLITEGNILKGTVHGHMFMIWCSFGPVSCCHIFRHPELMTGQGGLAVPASSPPASCIFMIQSCRSWWFSKYSGACCFLFFLFH